MPLPLARTATTLETAPQTPRTWLGTAVKDQEADFGALYAAVFTAVSRTVFPILHDRTRPGDGRDSCESGRQLLVSHVQPTLDK